MNDFTKADEEALRQAQRFRPAKLPEKIWAAFANAGDAFVDFIDERAKSWGRMITWVLMGLMILGMIWIADHSWPNFAGFFGIKSNLGKQVFTLFGVVSVVMIALLTYRAHRTEDKNEANFYKGGAIGFGFANAVATLGLLGTVAANTDNAWTTIKDKIDVNTKAIERLELKYPIPPQTVLVTQAKADGIKALVDAKDGERIGWSIETCSADFEGPGASTKRDICNELAQLKAMYANAISAVEVSKAYETDGAKIEELRAENKVLLDSRPDDPTLKKATSSIIQVNGKMQLYVSIGMILIIVTVLEILLAGVAWFAARSA